MRVLETFPTFYQELVQLWVIISKVEPKNIDNILNESLWNNSFVTAIGKPVFHQSFFKQNILNVSDLLTESGSFLTWQMAKQKYNLNDGQFLDWLGIINSIPSDWKSQIKLHFLNNTSQYKTATQHCMVPDMSVNTAYNSLVKSLKKPLTSQKNLEKNLGISKCRLAHSSHKRLQLSPVFESSSIKFSTIFYF